MTPRIAALAMLLLLACASVAQASDSPHFAFRPVHHEMAAWKKTALISAAGVLAGAILEHQFQHDSETIRTRRVIVPPGPPDPPPHDCRNHDCR